jgi:hypothetical protein
MATQATPHTNGAHPHNGSAKTSVDMQAWRDAVAMYTQRALDYYGPDLASRIDKARRIVLDGRVKPNGQHAHVGSETDAETIYAVTREGCDCMDAESKAPQGMCKHLIAWQIYRCAYGAVKGSVTTPTETAPAPEPTEAALRIPAQFITHLHGKEFVQFGGLLAMAHEQGLQSLTARFITVEADLATAEATAVFQDGRRFTECGDASPSNVGAHIRPHFARMALTRAKARALRDALNIGMCSVEELAD